MSKKNRYWREPKSRLAEPKPSEIENDEEEEERQDVTEDEDDELLSEDVPETVPVSQPVTIPEIKCNCCGKNWLTEHGALSKPDCGCWLHPVCKGCSKCEGHCSCRTGAQP